MDLPDSIRTVDVPDRELGTLSALSITRAATRYLAARAAGNPGRSTHASRVRFIPHTPEEAAAWRDRKPAEPQTQRRPRAYTYRRSAVDAYTARRSSAATEAPLPAVPTADLGKRCEETTSRATLPAGHRADPSFRAAFGAPSPRVQESLSQAGERPALHLSF